MASRQSLAIAAVVVGLLLVTNPLYLGAITAPPESSDQFRASGVYYAEFTAAGFVALIAGAHALLRDDPLDAREATAIAAGAVVGTVAAHRVTFDVAPSVLGEAAYWAVGGTIVTSLNHPSGEGLFIEVAVATLFVLGVVAAVGVEESTDVLVGLAVVFGALVLLRSALVGIFSIVGAGLRPDLLGVPVLSFLVVATPFVLGRYYNALLAVPEDGAAESDTAAA